MAALMRARRMDRERFAFFIIYTKPFSGRILQAWGVTPGTHYTEVGALLSVEKRLRIFAVWKLSLQMRASILYQFLSLSIGQKDYNYGNFDDDLVLRRASKSQSNVGMMNNINRLLI